MRKQIAADLKRIYQSATVAELSNARLSSRRNGTAIIHRLPRYGGAIWSHVIPFHRRYAASFKHQLHRVGQY
ncbi:hypothetical protein [Methylomonas fluvii]